MDNLSTFRSPGQTDRLTALVAEIALGVNLLAFAASAAARDGADVVDINAASATASATEAVDLSADALFDKAGGSPQAGLPLYLEIYLGDRSTGLIAHLVLRDNRLYASPAELTEIGLRVDGDLAVGEDGLLALDSLPGLTYDYQASDQRLRLNAPAELRPRQALGYRRPGAVHATRGHGLLFNYDLYAQHASANNSLALGSTLRWFGAAGTVEVSGVSHVDSDSSRAFERLETRWSYSDPTHLWTWAAGDLVSGSLPWTRSVRLGGVQWRRNFAVRPDLITYPVPRFSGQATVPSTIELLINGVQQFSADIQDGPFALDAFPRLSGAGEATVVLRDALGRVTQATVPLYIDAQRLAPGFSDFSLELGKLRRGFGNGQDGYGPVVGSGSFRWGVSDALTMESHAELGSGLRLVGVGVVWSPGARWGLVTASVARSGSSGGAGSQRNLGYQWSGRKLGLDLSLQRGSAGFRDIGAAEAALDNQSAQSQDRVSFWMPMTRGNLSATWLRYARGDGSRGRLLSMSWSRTFWNRLALSANLLSDQDSGIGVGLSLGYAVRPTYDLDASAEFGHDANRFETSLRHQSSEDTGWGWELAAGESGSRFVRAASSVRGPLGEGRFGAEQRGGRSAFYAQAAGSLVWMSGHPFLSRRVNDAFAVVNSNGVPRVPVLYENRAAGLTDKHGLLLLTDLHGWQRNRISIDPDALPGSYRLPVLSQEFIPADGGGFEAVFALAALHPAVVVLLDGSGAVIPAGTPGSIEGKQTAFLVGYDGLAYLEDVEPGAVLRVEKGETACRYQLPAPSAAPQGASPPSNQLSPIGACP